MARPQSIRLPLPAPAAGVVGQVGAAVEALPFWSQLDNVAPKGLDYLHPPTAVSRAYATQMLNLWLDNGVQRSRYGTAAVGSGIANIVSVINFINGAGVAWLLRFTTTKLQRWDGTTWTDVYTGFTGTTSDKFAFTAFNDKLIFSNGVNGLFVYDFDAGTVTLITGGPSCKYLTTFGGRVVAGHVTTTGDMPSRIQWSVKNNHLDWTGVGSGFEDLLSTPGGQIDMQRGTWPVTDTTALILRSKSVWQMDVTGSVDVPFRFARLYDNVGTDAPYSIDTVPGGIIGLFNDDFYVMSHQQLRPVGLLVRDVVLAQTTSPGNAVGMFDPVTKNYWFSNQTFVYRYSFNDQGWSRHSYPFSVVWMTHTRSSLTGLTIDGLDAFQATIDALDASFSTIDGMVGALSVVGNFFVSGGATRYVIREDSTVTTDADGAGGTTNSTIQIVTGAAGLNQLVRTRVMRTEVVREETTARNLLVEYSLDNGSTWSTYSTIALVSTTGPSVLPGRKTVDFRQALFRFSSTVLGKLSLQAVFLHAQRGPVVNL